MNQTTIQRVVTCSGIGLHSGNKVYLALRPASANTGIIFDIHTPDGIRRVSPAPKAVATTVLATTLGSNGATVSTAAAFLELFAEAGIRELPAPRKVMRISRPLELRDGEKYIRALPYAGFRVDCTIDFPHPTIGRERFSMEVTPENFTRVANARTFGFFKDVEYLHSHGLARGGSLESVVVLDDNGVMNPEGLRYKDEFVRHKVLDFIGDMAMLGMPIQGQFEICCSGHQLNNAFLRKAESERALQLIDLSLEEAQNRKTREKRPAYEGSLALA